MAVILGRKGGVSGGGVGSQPPVPFIQDADPGAVGEGAIWVDTTTDPPVVKVRNTADSAWLAVGGGSGIPVGSQSDVTLDTTTYDDSVRGSGKLAALVFGAEGAILAVAQAGDAFPRYIFTSDATDGIFFGDGTIDPYATGNAALYVSGGALVAASGIQASANVPGQAAALNQLSPYLTITSGALPTHQFTNGIGEAIPAATRDVETHTPVTFNPGAATTATCTVELSPDDVTYSTLSVITFPVGVVHAGSIRDVTVRVPRGWLLKLTVDAQASLGLTTYY